jgi:DNA helicase-2/ATP-dependent DNA helicase PcrA
MTEADKRILECLGSRTSFLLDAGAGSGKTSSLIRALNHIRSAERPSLTRNAQRVACITYTNVAKDEIIERTENDFLLQVSTIHDFLWSVISGFQKDLKEALLLFNAELPAQSRRKQNQDELRQALQVIDVIRYSDRGANFLEGRIFHDDLLGVAHVMFRRHPMLSTVVAANFPFIFVDEYQDTNEKVIAILMDHLFRCKNPPLIGFFGDKFQSIYPDVIGEMPAQYEAVLTIIKKEENYRCSKAVIGLLNRIRSDIQQAAAGDNVEGTACYVNLSGLNSDADVIAAAREAIEKRFGLRIEGEPKTLFLTHRLIARKAGYEALWTVYNNRGNFARERFQSGEDSIAQFFCKRVEPLLDAWRAGKTGRAISLLKEAGTSLAGRHEKERVRTALNVLLSTAGSNASIRDVLSHIRSTSLIPLLDDLETGLKQTGIVAEPATPDEEHEAFIAKLLEVPYREVSNYRAVLEDNLPYSTKHGVKGAEFENVFVILDDAGANWNQYSFGNLLAGSETNENRRHRTRNLFYVCCSRARVNLAVIQLGAITSGRTAIEALFGVKNVSLQ